jgi:hypothetical protein
MVAPHEGPDRHDQPDDSESEVDLEDGHERSESSATHVPAGDKLGGPRGLWGGRVPTNLNDFVHPAGFKSPLSHL